MSRRTTTRAAAAALLLPLALAGCSGSPSATAPAETGASASTPAGEGPFSSMPGDAVDTDTFVNTMSQAITEAGTYSILSDTQVSGSPVKVDGAADMSDPENPKFRGSMSIGGQGTEMVLVDRVIYLQLAGLAGGKYIEMPLEQLAGSLGDTNVEQLFDQREQLEAQKSAIESITYGGATTSDGTQLYKYTVVLDPNALMSELGATAAPQPSTDATGGTQELSYDYYVDDNALPHTVVVDDPSLQSHTRFSDYGKPVTITAPPSSEVTTLPSSIAPGGEMEPPAAGPSGVEDAPAGQSSPSA